MFGVHVERKHTLVFCIKRIAQLVEAARFEAFAFNFHRNFEGLTVIPNVGLELYRDVISKSAVINKLVAHLSAHVT